MPGDLEGLLVVSLEQAVAAPYASSRLADAGARVIKIERPEGDFARRYDRYVRGESAYFVWLNRGKQSCVLDIKDASDQALLRRILSKADVFIQNLAPGAAGRAGLESAGLRECFPRLITCDISGYGEQGPYQDMKAYDLLVQAESGLCGVTGSEDRPARIGVSVCDIGAGMYAHQGILQAIIGRASSGRGRGISVSLFDAMADWMNVPYLQFRYGGHRPPRSGLHHPTIAPYGAYACRDGELMLLSIQNEREWHKLCDEVLLDTRLAADPRFHDNPARVENRQALDAVINAVFGALERAELRSRLQAAGVAFGQLSSLWDLQHHPQLRLTPVSTVAGDVALLAPPVRVSDEAVVLGPVPAIGAHSEAIRKEFAAAD